MMKHVSRSLAALVIAAGMALATSTLVRADGLESEIELLRADLKTAKM